ncbi:MAG TPA: FAD-dependent monooxygenase [Steroidobacteraceae bacterium]|jgi:2-octaprenylphenol hydroxylase|nr:FAD-dependent monooxygenase [Steroidobacteraceae bacterium]
MSAEYEVVVVGAGPIGLSTAMLLARQARIPAGRIAVVDRHVPAAVDPRTLPVDLRVFAMSRASEKVLRVADAWGDIRAARASPYERMQVWHADVPPHGGDALVFDAAELGERDLGVIAENNVLQASLAAAARRAGIVLEQAEIDALAIERDAAVLQAGGRSLRARLVVGADGAQSRVRELAGVFASRASYGQVALVAMVSTAKPHQRTAWQRFLGDGTLAFLPLADGQSSIVWSLPTARAEQLLAAPPPDFERELESDFDAALGATRLTSDRLKFPLWRLSADHYVTERVALVGDAAHVVHPLAGQGANLGLLDAASLADVLAEGIADGEDPGALRILRRYERWRRSENELMSAAIDAFDRLLARGSGRIAEFAQRGMPWVGRSGLVKRAFIERAMGLAGELPAAAR